MHVTYEPAHQLEGGVTAQLAGTFDANGASLLWQTASQRVNEQTRFVVFDFSNVTILTSAGIGTLVRLYTRLKGYGGGLAVFGCSEKVREIFAIVMLESILNVFDSEDQAWESLS